MAHEVGVVASLQLTHVLFKELHDSQVGGVLVLM